MMNLPGVLVVVNTKCPPTERRVYGTVHLSLRRQDFLFAFCDAMPQRIAIHHSESLSVFD